jgi:capsular polysaccharide biosynthesis protein
MEVHVPPATVVLDRARSEPTLPARTGGRPAWVSLTHLLRTGAAARADRWGRSLKRIAHRQRADVVGVLVGCLVLGAGLSVLAMVPTSYTATSVESLAPRDPSMVPADVVERVARSYEAYLSSPDLLAQLDGSPPGQGPELARATAVSVETGTANVTTTVTLTDPRRAAYLANQVALAGVARAITDPLVIGEVTASAAPEATTSQPPRLLLGVVAAAVAAVAGVLAASLTLFVRAHRGRHPA